MAEIIDINISEVVENVQITTTENLTTVNINKVTGSGASWGEIEGTLSNQTDLQNALNLKANESELGATAFSNDYNDLDNKPPIPNITNLVPYTGASQNVDLGEYQIKADQVEFDQTSTQIAGVAKLRWNDTDGTLDLGLKGGNVTLQIGQESVIRVVNKTGSNLLESNYQAVRVNGAQGQRLKIDLAQATNDLLSAETIGLITENINNNQEGFVTTSGLIRGVNTTGSLQGETWADGDMLFLSPTTAGQITNIKPTAPNHLITIGYVVYAHANNGSIFVKVDNGYELEELHNVTSTNYTTPIDTDSLLTFDVTNSLWKRLTWANIKANLKTYFDSIYTTSSAVASQITTALVGYATQSFVNTGLATKQDKFFSHKLTTPTSYVTGTVSETEVYRLTIPANTLSASDAIKMPLMLIKKLGTNGTVQIRGKMSTSPTMPTGTTDLIFTTPVATAGNQTLGIIKTFFIDNGNIKGTPFTNASYGDTNAQVGVISEKPFDIAVTNYLYLSVINGSASDQTRLEAFQLTNS